MEADGNIVAAGWSIAVGGGDFALVRYTTSGTLDPTFGPGGKTPATFDALSTDR